MSKLLVRIEVAINLLAGKLVFPQFEEETKASAKVLGIAWGAQNSAEDVLSKRSRPFHCLGAFVRQFEKEVGDFLAVKAEEIQNWLKKLQTEHNFPSMGEYLYMA